MAVLTAERDVPRKGPESTGTPPLTTILLKAGVKVWKGALVGTDATGYGVTGAALQATGIKIWGIAQATVDNTSGGSGATSVDVFSGVFPFANLGGDPIVQATMGAGVFADDDQTARLTNGGGTRSAMGIFVGFDENSLALVRVGNFSQTGV
jgi:hypothetical protein